MGTSAKTTPNRPTIHDVARVAGVSKSTVSRVLNERGYASPETIEQVQRAIDELNYVPHASARSLVKRRTNALGLAVNELVALFTISLLSGIDAVARSRRYNLLIAATGHLKEEAGPPPLGAHNVDGIIAFADSYSDEQLRQFNEQNFPFVLIHRHPPEGVTAPSVNIENVRATKALVTHLIEVHKLQKIIFLQGPPEQQDAVEREQGYREALEEHGIPYDPTLAVRGVRADSAAQALSELIADGVSFDAVCAWDDEAAIGVIRALKQHGIRVPHDVAVVGFDDEHRAADIDPPLTTVHVPFEEVGEEAANVLIDLIENGNVTSSLVPTSVVIRNSCGC